MKLLSMELFGEYKGLRDQAFDYPSAFLSDRTASLPVIRFDPASNS